jgi:uncharacterized protein YjbI with pentapeptide repeats
LKSLSDIVVPDLSFGRLGPRRWSRPGALCTVGLAVVRGVRHHDHVLAQGWDYDGETFEGDLTGQDAGTSRFLECRFEGCDLTGLRAPRARLSETGLYAVHGAGLDLSDSSWQDCVVRGARLGAVALHGAEVSRVRFEGCKVDYLNLRGARLRDVQFVDCQLLEPDFAEATLTGVDFSGSRLVAAEFGRATLSRVDLSDALLTGPRGLASLRGATISRVQLLELADAFADELGITVSE